MRNLLLVALLVVFAVPAIGSTIAVDPPTRVPAEQVSPPSVTEPDQPLSQPTEGSMATSFSTFLMFEGDAREAIDLYTSVFPEAEVVRMDLFGPDAGPAEGTVMGAELRLGDQRVRFFDSPAPHDFSFTPSISFFVDFTSEDDLRSAYERLVEGGEVAMPLDSYDFSELFAWITDRFGVSWQLNLN